MTTATCSKYHEPTRDHALTTLARYYICYSDIARHWQIVTTFPHLNHLESAFANMRGLNALQVNSVGDWQPSPTSLLAPAGTEEHPGTAGAQECHPSVGYGGAAGLHLPEEARDFLVQSRMAVRTTPGLC